MISECDVSYITMKYSVLVCVSRWFNFPSFVWLCIIQERPRHVLLFLWCRMDVQKKILRREIHFRKNRKFIFAMNFAMKFNLRDVLGKKVHIYFVAKFTHSRSSRFFQINRKFTYASARSSEIFSTKIKFTCGKNRKFTSVSWEVQKKIWYAEKFIYEEKGSSVVYSEKFIHYVSNFRSASWIGSSHVLNEKFRKRWSS